VVGDFNTLSQQRKNMNWAFLFFLSISSCNDGSTVISTSNTPLVYVGDETIGENDFLRALEKLDDDIQSLTLSDWRQRLQVLIDNELMLIEAKRRGLNEDAKVKAAVDSWERERVIGKLLQKNNKGDLSPTSAQIKKFFETTGAANEITLQRVDVMDQKTAFDILNRLESGADFTEIARINNKRVLTTDWLNQLMVDERYAPLFVLQKGNVELLEAEGRFIIAHIKDRRKVSLEQRYKLVEGALRRKMIQEANLKLLADLAENYEVQIDTVTIGLLLEGRADNAQRLLTSSLGEWTVGQYQLANKSLTLSDSPPSLSIPQLGFHITRVFIVSQILAEEKRKLGIDQDIAIERKKILNQKMLETLWQTDIYSQIMVENAELRAFYQKHKARYSSLSENTQALNNQVSNDIREAKAQPLFVSFVENLRNRLDDVVVIEEDNFRDFVTRQRNKQVPVDL
jgi:hypothetical protein